jgi:DNA polymerase family A
MAEEQPVEVCVTDAEFTHDSTGMPVIVCMSGKEIYSGRTFSLWADEIGDKPPYNIGQNSIVVFYSGTEAELAVHMKLFGEPLPVNVVDEMTEYRMAINGRGGSQGLGMLDACERLGIVPRVTHAEKKRLQERIVAGFPFSAADRDEILLYNRGDVEDECAILRALIELGQDPLSKRAVWRGEFVKSVARMWYRGVPIDPQYVSLATDPMARLDLKRKLICDIRTDYPVYDNNLVLKEDLLNQYYINHNIVPPLTKTGKPSSSADALGTLARDNPILVALNESLRTQRQLKDFSLPIFSDCRLRAWFAPFMTITSRAAPPTNGYIYNLPAWMRSTMKPPQGYALAYMDFSAMEFGLSASCSGDPNMIEFYNSGDPYIATAIAAGALPAGATKFSHRYERDLYKTGVLACLYGIWIVTLALRLKRSELFADGFLKMHHELFWRYWEWSDAVVADAISSGEYVSRHGWRYTVQPGVNVRSLRNWPIQTLGAEILRCACIWADRFGIEMLATAHDAVLIQAPLDRIEQDVACMSACMRRAARLLTDGFELRVDHEIKRGSERFVEERGRRTLAVVDRFLMEQANA